MTERNTTVRPGLVISYFGNSVAVEADDGQVFQCHLRRNQELPVVGDRVEWQFESKDTGSIVSILPRRSLLIRGEGRGKKKPVAANIDAVLVVMAPPPIFSDYIVDRYLIAAELLGLSPVLVLNKIDLLNDSNREDAYARLTPYKEIPYPVILSSIYTQDGLEEIARFMVGKTVVLVGPSGVGKSSIIAALGSDGPIRVGDVSPKGAGKHTTTATRLYHLTQGGNIIDSPGVREFNLWSVTKKEILSSFPEFKNFLKDCKFRDCFHIKEPSCAVKAAVAEGKISEQRYATYQRLMEASPDSPYS